MAAAANTCADPFDLSKVVTCKIHPGIGIARVGNSPDEYFIGPEAPLDTASAPELYKDGQGRVKRQGARFRIFAYDADGNILGELPIAAGANKGNGQPPDPAKAHVTWTVHLANKKGAWHKFVPIYKREEDVGLRNSDIPAGHRNRLIIDPGPRSITGARVSENCLFDTGEFRGTKVFLGELKTDDEGRLVVLGGFGKSASTKEDNPIGADPKDAYWSDNDYWYDDVSDGKVSAVVRLPNGETIEIKEPEDTAWVVVAPPKFAPGIMPVVTLYDVIRAVFPPEEGKIGALDNEVHYYRDIYPVLTRAADTGWVNETARRGHGYDKRGDFRRQALGDKLKLNDDFLTSPEVGVPAPDAGPAAGIRQRIFNRLRTPKTVDGEETDEETRNGQATASYMPALSGDWDDAKEGDPNTWLTLLGWQYVKFREWADGNFIKGEQEKYVPLECMTPACQVVALQRAALEPCVGGPFYPGIEMTYYAADRTWYVDAFRIDADNKRPGDVTKNMALPWQADFADCRITWWPAQRPDDVMQEAIFDEANDSWEERPPTADGKPDPDQAPVQEALLGRVKWDRGLGVTTLFRQVWHNPLPPPPRADAEGATSVLPDESMNDQDLRRCDDMVRYWHELGFVRPRETNSGEIVHVEMERRPYAGMPIRDLFHALLNINQHRDAYSKIIEYVEAILEGARKLQQGPQALTFLDNIRPFVYSEEAFIARMKAIYDDTVDFADFKGAVLRPYNPSEDPWFTDREGVVERIRQLTPFNLLDGSWLRNIHHLGQMDDVNAALFSILKEELGEGIPAWNHANIYLDLCHSVGLNPPPVASTAFIAEDQGFLDAAFESPTFQLGLSEFTREYYPELIGMTLYLEWTVVTLHRAAALLEAHNIDARFYRMHIGIDNAANGHGAQVLRAVQIYLQQIRSAGGNVQEEWDRIWNGYVAFGYTFSALIYQIKYRAAFPPSAENKLIAMIKRKAEFGQYNHRDKKLGQRLINSWFTDPKGFLCALQEHKYIKPGDPDGSPFFRLLKFEGGRMYRVFSDEEIKVWRDWTLQLKCKPKPTAAATPVHRREAEASMHGVERHFARLQEEGHLNAFHAVSKQRLHRWLRHANVHAPGEATAASAGLAYAAATQAVSTVHDDKYNSWLAWSMVRAVIHVGRDISYSLAAGGITLEPIELGKDERHTIAEWFEMVQKSANPAVAARSFMTALKREIEENTPSAARFQALITTQTNVLGDAFASNVPGNDRYKAVDTIRAWIGKGCPLPRIRIKRAKPLSLESTFDEEEHHPLGVHIGFGRIS
jgi:hypothetical protein